MRVQASFSFAPAVRKVKVQPSEVLCDRIENKDSLNELPIYYHMAVLVVGLVT